MCTAGTVISSVMCVVAQVVSGMTYLRENIGGSVLEAEQLYGLGRLAGAS